MDRIVFLPREEGPVESNILLLLEHTKKQFFLTRNDTWFHDGMF